MSCFRAFSTSSFFGSLPQLWSQCAGWTLQILSHTFVHAVNSEFFAADYHCKFGVPAAQALAKSQRPHHRFWPFSSSQRKSLAPHCHTFHLRWKPYCMKTVSPTHWSNTGIGICGSRCFKSWHTGKTWGNIEQGRAERAAQPEAPRYGSLVRVCPSRCSTSAESMSFSLGPEAWRVATSPKYLLDLWDLWVHCPLDAMFYMDLHGRVSTRGGTRFSLTLLQRSETFVAHPRVHTFHTRPCRSKRLAPIRHSWTCRASLSRQHYTMNMSDLHCLWLTFLSNFFALLLSNMSRHVYNNSLSDLWEFNFWSSASACVIVCPCAHRVEHIESSSAKALKFQLPFMGQCQNLHPQQVPVPNLTTIQYTVFALQQLFGKLRTARQHELPTGWGDQSKYIQSNHSSHDRSHITRFPNCSKGARSQSWSVKVMWRGKFRTNSGITVKQSVNVK